MAPIYDFECGCGRKDELILRIADMDKPQKCPECGEEMKKVWGSPPAIRCPGDTHRKKMRRRYKKRNARINAMPKEQQKRMSAFARKHNVKRTLGGD